MVLSFEATGRQMPCPCKKKAASLPCRRRRSRFTSHSATCPMIAVLLSCSDNLMCIGALLCFGGKQLAFLY